jgi:hypothetical protein
MHFTLVFVQYVISGYSGIPDPKSELLGIKYYDALFGVIFQNLKYFFPKFRYFPNAPE